MVRKKFFYDYESGIWEEDNDFGREIELSVEEWEYIKNARHVWKTANRLITRKMGNINVET